MLKKKDSKYLIIITVIKRKLTIHAVFSAEMHVQAHQSSCPILPSFPAACQTDYYLATQRAMMQAASCKLQFTVSLLVYAHNPGHISLSQLTLYITNHNLHQLHSSSCLLTLKAGTILCIHIHDIHEVHKRVCFMMFT